MQDYTTGTKEVVWGVHYISGELMRIAAMTSHAVYVWRVGQAEPIAEFPWNFIDDEDERGMILAISPDQRWMAGTTSHRIHVWDLTKEVPKLQRTINAERLLEAGFSSEVDEMVVVAGTTDSKTKAIHIPIKGRKAFKFDATMPLVTDDDWNSSINTINLMWLREGMTLSADGRWFAGTAGGKQVPVWDCTTGWCAGSVSLRRSPTRLALSPDGGLLALDAGTTLYVYETKTFTKVSSWKTKYTYYPDLAWSPDSEQLARVDSSTTLRIFEVARGRELAALTNKRGRNTAVAFAPDGLTCLVGTFDGQLRMWDVG